MQPILETLRLVLRPYAMSDAADVRRLAGDSRVADTTATIPHPYPDGAAEQWIAGHAAAFESRRTVAYAITLRESGELVGTVSLMDIQLSHARAELGYWIGVEHWGKGYCTEAVERLVAFARQEMQLSRIVARCLARNPASARVMEKAGLSREGLLPMHDRKKGKFEDVLVYGVVFPERSKD